ncbi:hypothetical protein [Sphaerisporangium sp. TRM90804]|uniref:hypothetical protein n=1 Tax=Sphaerisporangium sp. TRM90804 TaxID=3031113 RepID=UPI0024480CF0|nr:hypothetical protein [Sphaerisporangium sp. TRM90804]MDH2429329.1 hypothetical protein [Sphaerisporangium sp. TRM90804]
MAVVNATVPVERISAEARRVDGRQALAAVGKVLATLLLALPYAAGWFLHKLWMGLVLVWMAGTVGWRDAGPPAAPDEADPT